MRAYKARGGTVLLLTNAPRGRASVAKQMAKMNLPEDAWDVIATSGDSARVAMFEGAVGSRVWFMGEGRDQSFFEPLQIIENPTEITQVPLEEAEGIVCTGPFDPMADPSTLRPECSWPRPRG